MYLVELNLYRGPRPKDMLELKTAGVETIINLEYFAQEREFPADFGIEEYCIKCTELVPPSQWDRDQAIRIILRGRKTYVHCTQGVDRSGLVVMDYRMRVDNWPFEKAYQEWVKMGRHWWYDWWKYSLKSR